MTEESATERMRAHVTRLVDVAPPLTQEQVLRLRTILQLNGPAPLPHEPVRSEPLRFEVKE